MKLAIGVRCCLLGVAVALVACGGSGDSNKTDGPKADGPPSGERVDRALEIVRAPGHLARARSAVVGEVDRAHGLTARLPDGPARTALGQLAEFLAARCGARGPGDSRSERGRVSGSPRGQES